MMVNFIINSYQILAHINLHIVEIVRQTFTCVHKILRMTHTNLAFSILFDQNSPKQTQFIHKIHTYMYIPCFLSMFVEFMPWCNGQIRIAFRCRCLHNVFIPFNNNLAHSLNKVNCSCEFN